MKMSPARRFSCALAPRRQCSFYKLQCAITSSMKKNADIMKMSAVLKIGVDCHGARREVVTTTQQNHDSTLYKWRSTDVEM